MAGVKERKIWQFKEERVVPPDFRLGFIFNESLSLPCTLVKHDDDPTQLLEASKILPDHLFLNIIGGFEGKYLVYPRFEHTLATYMSENFGFFKEYFNKDMSFSEDFVNILRCFLEAFQWLHNSGRFYGNFDLSDIVIQYQDNKMMARLASCKLRSADSIETLRHKQNLDLRRFLKLIVLNLDKNSLALLEAASRNSEIRHFLITLNNQNTTCAMLLAHPALWTEGERVSKIFYAMDIRGISTARLAFKQKWTKDFGDPTVQDQLCESRLWSYADTTTDLVRLYKNVYMHLDDSRAKVVNNKRFRRLSENPKFFNVTLKGTVESGRPLPPSHIILRSKISEFFWKLSEFILQQPNQNR